MDTKDLPKSDIQDEEEGATFVEECPVGTICRNATIIASDPMGGLNLDMGCTDGTEISGDGVRFSYLFELESILVNYICF